MLSEADRLKVAEIEAALAEYRVLLEQGEELYLYPIIDVVGAAEERYEEFMAIRGKRLAVRQKFPGYLDALLALVKRLSEGE